LTLKSRLVRSVGENGSGHAYTNVTLNDEKEGACHAIRCNRYSLQTTSTAPKVAIWMMTDYGISYDNGKQK